MGTWVVLNPSSSFGPWFFTNLAACSNTNLVPERMLFLCIVWLWPPSQDASDHQEYDIFRLGDPELNLHFPLLLGGGHPQCIVVIRHEILNISSISKSETKKSQILKKNTHIKKKQLQKQQKKQQPPSLQLFFRTRHCVRHISHRRRVCVPLLAESSVMSF